MTRLLILGGSDAGISAALSAREIDTSVKVTVVVADGYPNYSVCGLPFYLSGEVPDWHQLAHRTAEEISREGIDLLLDHTARRIDPLQHVVAVTDELASLHLLTYDRLIIATGARSVRPAMSGLDLPGVYSLRSMADSFAVQQHLSKHAPRSAVIIGGGYIGLEMADALTLRGLAVTVVEHNPWVLKTVDESLGHLVSRELQRHGVTVVNGVAIRSIEQAAGRLRILDSHDYSTTADLVLVGVGVEPNSLLAQQVGVETGGKGAIRVTRAMETNLPDVFAAGDCVETWHRLLATFTYLPLGTTAHKQGRIAGANAVGGHHHFAGTLGTQVVKVFDLVIARTGLRDNDARDGGFDPLTVETTQWDHKVYYPGAQELCIRLTGDRKTGRLLGAQMVGALSTEVAKRIDVVATALFHGMDVDGLNDLDLAYTPPVSSPWDPLQMSAQTWMKQQQQPA